MYDSIVARDIPADAALIAGYVDGPLSRWTDTDWQRFPHAKKVRICTWGPRNNGDCLDIERGDSIPEDARPWAENALQRGVAHPILYMSLSDFPLVRSYCAGLPCLFWVAHYTQTPHIPLGADACQYADWPMITGGDFDLSLCTPQFVNALST